MTLLEVLRLALAVRRLRRAVLGRRRLGQRGPAAGQGDLPAAGVRSAGSAGSAPPPLPLLAGRADALLPDDVTGAAEPAEDPVTGLQNIHLSSS